jgi:tetratricopeptide (TPR) repeat protein
MALNTEEKNRNARQMCEQGLWPEVLAFARQWHEEEPGDYKALYYLGLGFGGIGRFSDAETAYRRALAIQPSDPWLWNNLGGLLYEGLHRHAEGIQCLEQAVRIDAGYKIGWINLAAIAGRLGNYQQVLIYADQALALDRGLVEAYLHKGAAAMSLGRMDLVKEVCGILASFGPEKFRRAR